MEQGQLFCLGPGAKQLTQGPLADACWRSLFQGAVSQACGVRGDHDLNPGFMPPGPLREAAVLVPLVSRPEGATLLLTQRTDHLACHAGQICFPGGRLEPTDVNATDAALRETEEEIGLTRDRIDLIGRLDTYVTRTGFRITPLVGVVRQPFEIVPDPTEVADVFEVPLALILDAGHPKQHSRDIGGKPRRYYAFPYGNRDIWGATAGILVNLRDVLKQAC